MNCEPHIVSATFLSRLNNSITQLKAQQETICNDMTSLQDLHELYYDLRYSMISNKALQDPSIILEIELDAIHEHLILTLKHLRSRQKKRLVDLHSNIFKEELEHPQVNLKYLLQELCY